MSHHASPVPGRGPVSEFCGAGAEPQVFIQTLQGHEFPHVPLAELTHATTTTYISHL